MLHSKERKGKAKKGKGIKERKEREGREGQEGKETGRKVKRKEKKGTTAIWSDIVCNIGWKCYLALEFGMFGIFSFQKMQNLVDRVATKSMDSRGKGTDFGATAIWSELCANWLEMLPCTRI